MDQPIKILILEDVPADAELMEEELEKDGIIFQTECATNGEQFHGFLKEWVPDIILADCQLPQYDGISALNLAKQTHPEIPLVFVSGTIGEEKAIELLKLGAADYVLKNNLLRLPLVVKRALKEADQKKEKKELEKKLRTALKMEAIGALTSGIAHDFNNILSSILGFTDLMLENIPIDSPLEEDLKEVKQAGVRAADLVRQILTYCRMVESELQPLNIAPIIMEVLKLIKSTIPVNIKIDYAEPENLDKIMADPSQIHQIIMNLCTNAAHAMGEKGGDLKIQPQNVVLEEKNLKPQSLLKPGPHVKLTIKDTGHGISKEILDSIFDPYFTTKTQGEGTGLGLSVVHGIVLKYKGDIEVISQPGKGTEFTIYLPRTEESPKVIPVPAIITDTSGIEKILIVDDDPAILKLTSIILTRQGYKTTTKSDGNKALEVFTKDPRAFDLVITDMSMPSINGDKLASKILEINPDIPVILATGFCDNELEKNIKKIGIQALVMKPFCHECLGTEVRRLLNKAKK